VLRGSSDSTEIQHPQQWIADLSPSVY
jgi:hypothetical protein